MPEYLGSATILPAPVHQQADQQLDQRGVDRFRSDQTGALFSKPGIHVADALGKMLGPDRFQKLRETLSAGASMTEAA